MSLKDVTLAFGGAPVLDGVSVSISKRLRAALTGRNGEGKSTLMKVLAGELEPDSGEIVRAPNLRVAYVSQSVPSDRPGDDAFNALSGGRRRRQILEEALLSQPDVLLLDEPTNHLDVEAIDWLEGMIRRQREMAVIIVTHDRRFLKRVATKIYDLDRGELSGWECDYPTFVKRKAELLADEAVYWERKSKKLAQEEAWIRRGVKARTTRNEGRVAALMKLREEFAARRTASGTATMRLDTAAPGGVRVLKIENLCFSYGGKPVIRDFTADVLRGERIGILGRNGAGKTTLIKLLTGRLAPTSGSVTIGTNVEISYFDQLRSEIKPELTVAENIASDCDQVTVGGVRKHVFSYLADFLFSSDRARTPVKALSGGERARLMLAKLFLRPANLLVMDEPTNDLDIETLELLEEQLLAYSGTLLLVSHDREFLDNVVTSTFVLEGDGTVAQYPGGYADYEAQSKSSRRCQNGGAGSSTSLGDASRRCGVSPRQEDDKTETSRRCGVSPRPANEQPKKLSYKEQRELDALPAKIEALEQELAQIREALSDGAIYRSDPTRAKSLSERLPVAEAELESCVDRWAELEERA
ncbi:MAG: ATP-binding cassette domain-containing protein [Lentisphaerae bacterium]|nr:ATP-binding cassette domain-containing protein [Lentisphaerota bacterium]